ENNEIIQLAESLENFDEEIIDEISNQLKTIGSDTTILDTNNALEDLQDKYHLFLNTIEENRIEISRNIDLPKWFNYEELITEFIERAIKEAEGSKDRLRENVSTLKL